MLALCTLTVWNNKYNSDWVGIETEIGQINETMSTHPLWTVTADYCFPKGGF